MRNSGKLSYGFFFLVCYLIFLVKFIVVYHAKKKQRKILKRKWKTRKRRKKKNLKRRKKMKKEGNGKKKRRKKGKKKRRRKGKELTRSSAGNTKYEIFLIGK